MDETIELLRNLNLNPFEVGTATSVEVTHINNPHSFYVRPYSHRPYMKEIESAEDYLDPVDIQPETIVVYMSRSRRNMVRGEITYVDSSTRTCVMWALDYGVEEINVPFDVVHKPKLALSAPPLAVHCRLHHCEPLQGKDWEERSIEAMKSCVGTEKANMIVRDNTSAQLSVELYNSSPDDISTLLAMSGHSTMNSGSFSDLATRLIPEGRCFTHLKINRFDHINVQLIHIESATHFYVAKVEDYEKYVDQQSNVTTLSKQENKLREEEIVEGRPVAVFIGSSSQYERAVIKKILVPGQKASVQLVDVGKTHDAYRFQLKSLPRKLFDYPAIAIYCTLIPRQAKQNLTKKFDVGMKLGISIVKVGDDHVSPHLVIASVSV